MPDTISLGRRCRDSSAAEAHLHRHRRLTETAVEDEPLPLVCLTLSWLRRHVGRIDVACEVPQRVAARRWWFVVFHGRRCDCDRPADVAVARLRRRAGLHDSGPDWRGGSPTRARSDRRDRLERPFDSLTLAQGWASSQRRPGSGQRRSECAASRRPPKLAIGRTMGAVSSVGGPAEAGHYEVAHSFFSRSSSIRYAWKKSCSARWRNMMNTE